MLRITKIQFEAFQKSSLAVFEATMVDHCKGFSPKLSAKLSEDQLYVFIRKTINKAASHGFTFKGPVRLFIELSLLFGSGFDVDVQYPWVRECLFEPESSTQMQRAEALHERAIEALGQTHGPGNSFIFIDNALLRLQALSSTPPSLNTDDFSEIVLATMAHIHPQKYVYINEPSLRLLIASGKTEASRQGFYELSDVLFVIILMFVFGQYCATDPLYPWIKHTLSHDMNMTPSLRARQLKKETLTWLR